MEKYVAQRCLLVDEYDCLDTQRGRRQPVSAGIEIHQQNSVFYQFTVEIFEIAALNPVEGSGQGAVYRLRGDRVVHQRMQGGFLLADGYRAVSDFSNRYRKMVAFRSQPQSAHIVPNKCCGSGAALGAAAAILVAAQLGNNVIERHLAGEYSRRCEQRCSDHQG